MQVTKEGDYALRAVIYLSMAEPRTCAAREVSEEQNVPPKFLARIMPKLVKKGIIVSLPGSKGGYRLARPAREINFLEVLEAIEGPLRLNVCLGEDLSDCEHESLCGMQLVWKSAQDKVTDYFSHVTFDKLTEPPCKMSSRK